MESNPCSRGWPPVKIKNQHPDGSGVMMVFTLKSTMQQGLSTSDYNQDFRLLIESGRWSSGMILL